MKRKILTAVLSLALCATTLLSLPNSVLAGEGTVKGDAESDAPTNWAGGAQDIDVIGETVGVSGHDIVYSIKIEWGAMKFVFDYGGKWNPETHEYDKGTESGEVEPGWVEDYVDGDATDTDADGRDIYNNSITIINDSNYPIDAKLTFALKSSTVFNASTDAHKVTGVFGTDKDTLWSNFASDLDCSPSAGDLKSEFSLHCSDASKKFYSGSLSSATPTEKTVFFTLCGLPTKSVSSTKVGTIKVAIVPCTT